MMVGVVTSICKSQGMSSVCLASGCVYNPPDCRATPLGTYCGTPMTGLSKKICNYWAPDYCHTFVNIRKVSIDQPGLAGL